MHTDIKIGDTEVKDHLMFIGRWSPFHKGHEYIIRQKLKEFPDKPILVLVRDTSFDAIDPQMRVLTIERWMKINNIPGTIMVIPDIKGVYYGRGVGYQIEEIDVPEEIKKISATDIRNKMSMGDDSWKEAVPEGTEEIVAQSLSQWGFDE